MRDCGKGLSLTCQKRFQASVRQAFCFFWQRDRCTVLRWIQQLHTHEQTAIMETADTPTLRGNHHDPPIANHTADAVTATNARMATGRYGVPMKPLTEHHRSGMAEDSALLSGVATVSASVFIAIDTCPSLHYMSLGDWYGNLPRATLTAALRLARSLAGSTPRRIRHRSDVTPSLLAALFLPSAVARPRGLRFACCLRDPCLSFAGALLIPRNALIRLPFSPVWVFGDSSAFSSPVRRKRNMESSMEA